MNRGTRLLARAVIAALAVLLLPAQAASAGTVTSEGSTVFLSEPDGDVGQNSITLYYNGAAHGFIDQFDVTTVSTTACTPMGAVLPGNPITCAAATDFVLSLGGGNDFFTGSQTAGTEALLPLTVNGGPGLDTIIGGADDDVVEGGVDADTINGGGGTGDVVTYANHASPVTVNLGIQGQDDGSSEDGAEGARDAVNAGTVEGVTGGPAADNLQGTSGANRLEGGGGGDVLNALGGPDLVFGGSGVDNIEARDGVADTVDCGPDEDSALTDSVDTRIDCDPPAAPPAAGAPAAAGTPAAASTPSTVERLRPRLVSKVEVEVDSTSFKRLQVAGIPGGSTVAATCKLARNRRCGTLTKANAPATLRVKSLESRALPVGARIEIRVTKPGAVGAHFLLTVRKGKKPSLVSRCIAPGATSPSPCT